MPASEITAERFEEWAILELMGHRRLAGRVSEMTVGGAALIRIDVPEGLDGDGVKLTQLYAPGAIYCITPVAESVARGFAARLDVAPISRWELDALPRREDPDDEMVD